MTSSNVSRLPKMPDAYRLAQEALAWQEEKFERTNVRESDHTAVLEIMLHYDMGDLSYAETYAGALQALTRTKLSVKRAEQLVQQSPRPVSRPPSTYSARVAEAMQRIEDAAPVIEITAENPAAVPQIQTQAQNEKETQLYLF